MRNLTDNAANALLLKSLVFKAAVLASGEGTNFEHLVRAARAGEMPGAEIVCLVADRPCPALERAQHLKVASYCLPLKNYTSRFVWQEAVMNVLKTHNVAFIALAGFLRKIEPPLLDRYSGRILNLHPALLPKFGGQGMYGRSVHEAVLAAGEKESGATVHLVDALYDHGPILMQERVSLAPGETVESLEARIHALEHRLYPKAIAKFLQDLAAGSAPRLSASGAPGAGVSDSGPAPKVPRPPDAAGKDNHAA